MRWQTALFVLAPALLFAGEPTRTPDLRPFVVRTMTPEPTPTAVVTPPLDESRETAEQAALLLEIHEKLGRLAAEIEKLPKR